MRAFNESVRVTFFIWPLACVLAADQATATVLGNGSLVSLNSSTPSHTAFPFMTNEPKNQLESNWVPLLDMGYTSEDVSSLPAALIWETTAQSVLDEQPSITALEDFLAGFTSLTYSLLVQGWRSRYLADNATSPPVWVPQYPIGTGEHPKLKAHLQVNGLPLLVGSLGVLVLGTISVLCVVGHGITDGIVRDGGVIDLVSLLNNSALPEIVAGPEEYSGDQGVGGTTFMTRGARASRVMVASVFHAFHGEYILMLHSTLDMAMGPSISPAGYNNGRLSIWMPSAGAVRRSGGFPPTTPNPPNRCSEVAY